MNTGRLLINWMVKLLGMVHIDFNFLFIFNNCIFFFSVEIYKLYCQLCGAF